MSGQAFMLPPREGHCRVCATKHDAEAAHNLQSLPYGVYFMDKYGRSPTWYDAVAHLPEGLANTWIEKLKEVYEREDLEWPELPEGAEPIADPVETDEDRIGNPVIPVTMKPTVHKINHDDEDED